MNVTVEPCCDYRDQGGTPCACECHGTDWWEDVDAIDAYDDRCCDPSRDNEAFEGWGPGL